MERILNVLSRMESQLLDNTRATYRTEGKVDSLSNRVDRIEDREYRAKLTPKDFLSFLPGLLVLVLALAGKLSWAEALSHLIGSGQ